MNFVFLIKIYKKTSGSINVCCQHALYWGNKVQCWPNAEKKADIANSRISCSVAAIQQGNEICAVLDLGSVECQLRTDVSG